MSGIRTCLSVLLLAFLGLQCESLERDNPLDPARLPATAQAGTRQPEPAATLALEVPLPKALVRVVHRVVATLEGPGMQTVSKELSHPLLGPATGTIGAIPPGAGRILTISGYDLEGTLLFEGQQRDLVVVAGDTTRVSLDLRLVVQPSAPAPDDTSGSGAG